MKRYVHSSGRGSALCAIAVTIGVTVNVLLAFISYQTGLPIYLDTIGTIGVASVAGIFPGIMTAILTNTLCSLFNSDAIYFGIVNALIAMYSAYSIRKRSFRKAKNIAVFIIMAGIISGVTSAFIQWGIIGGPQNDALKMMLDSAANTLKAPRLPLFICINVLLNTFDKGFSLGVAQLIIRFVPLETRQNIRLSSWRQRPLSAKEIKAMDSLSGDSRFSLKRRITLMLIIVSFTLTIIMGWAGVSLYYKSAKEEKTKTAMNAVKFAADIIDADMIDDYIRYGSEAEGYEETEEMLYKIRNNAAGVEYLYILQIREDGCYVAFDLETDDEPAYKPGDKIEFEDAFKPYLDDLFAGKEIDPIESDDVTGWVLTTYYPILDSNGNCKAYAGADVSLSYMAGYTGEFLLRVLLILAGFFILVLAYAMWTAGIYLVYPINNIVECVEEFIRAGTNQEELDRSVKRLRSIDVHTNDEVEKLYYAICDMASNQTEQMRSIRRFSENTVKMQDGLIITMADLVENRDSDTGAHIQKTAAYVKIIVEGLKRKGYYAEKITPKFMSDVVRSAPLHDVGKINIPDSVLNKPGKLTDEEYAIIKTHTTAGKMIMEKAISTVEGENYLKEARNMAAYHHERWDGKGYPEGLHGEVIPLAARIMAVADVFDALASPRVYKPAFPLEKALSIIQEGSGTQFDPKCVEVFMEALPEVKEVLKKYTENV